MANHDDVFTPPDSWLLPLSKLTSEVDLFSKHITDITTMVNHNLEIGQINAISNTMPDLNKLYSESVNISSIMTRVENLTAIVDTPSSLLLNNQKSAFLSSDLVIGSTGSILASAASMAATICSATGDLYTTYKDKMNILGEDTLSHLAISDQSLTYSLQNNLYALGDKLQSNVSTFNSLIDTSLITSHLNAEIFTRPIEAANLYMANVSQSFKTLNLLSAKVYDDLITSQSICADSFLFKAPTVEPYAAMRATSVLAGFNDETLDKLCIESTDTLLDELGDELELRLQNVSPELAGVYIESIEALKSGHRGWIRHAGVSLRTLFDHLLRRLAPDSDLSSFFEDTESNKIDGEFSRNARLRYIFREVATGSYSKMVEQDIKLAEATFFPSNDIVHKLSSPLSEKQMRVFFRRIQGSVSVVLEAAGY